MRRAGSTNGRPPDGGLVLVVEDDPRVRELMVTTLSLSGYRARGAESGEDALALVHEERPDVVVTDIALPGMSGYELCHVLRAHVGETLPILFVSGVRTEPFDVVGGLLIGADDYLVKPFVPEELVARVRRALVRSALSGVPELQNHGRELTPREREVLSLLAQGLSQNAIAARLVISSTTVATHIQRILNKLEVHSRAEAVSWAYRTGLFEAEDTFPSLPSQGSGGRQRAV